MLTLKPYRRRIKGLADLLPYAALVEPDLVLCKDGSLLAVYEVWGKDTASCTADELQTMRVCVNRALQLLGSEFMLHCDSLRLPAPVYSPKEACFFPDPLSRMIDDERREFFEERGRIFITTTVLTITYKGSGLAGHISRITGATEKEESLLKQHLDAFKKTLLIFEDNLASALQLERLGSKKTSKGIFSPLLSYIQVALTGEEYLPKVPDTPMYLDALLGGQDLVGGLSPKIGKKYLALVALDGLPSESWPAMLSVLTELPFACRFSTRFICMDQAHALKEVDKYRKTWAQNIYRLFDKVLNKANPAPNRDAQGMTLDAEVAYTSLQNAYMGAGFYTAVMVLMDEDLFVLAEQVRIIRRNVTALGFGCRNEEINALEAWLGTHPGNSYANVRRPMISTLNLADFLPLSSSFTGRQYNPCPMYPPFSRALFQCLTGNSTPYWFNIHVGDVAHTIISGPTGTGKSALLAFMGLQFLCYPQAKVWSFDKGMSMYAVTEGVGGRHYDVGSSESPSFSPLQCLDTKEDQAWAAEWIATCAALAPMTVLPGHRNEITDTIQRMQNLPMNLRTLSTFCMEVQSSELKTALQHYTQKGGMGSLLDASSDGIEGVEASHYITFEIEELMNLGKKNLLPVLLYLFRVIEKSLKGQPTLLFLDEAWLMLDDPVFAAKIREYLKVFRKNNCGVILATQSISDLMHSDMLHVIINSCFTKVFLADARAKENQALYEKMGLNPQQMEIISEMRSKREYYVTSPEGSRKVELGLSPLALAFVGVSSKEDVARIKELKREQGEDWRAHWIAERTGAVL